LGLGLIGLLGN